MTWPGPGLRPTREIAAADASPAAVAALLDAPEPTIVRGLAADWPLVRAGLAGTAFDCVAGFAAAVPVVGYTGHPGGSGRYSYAADLTGMNFTRERTIFTDYLARMRDAGPDSPSLYLGSADPETIVPGLAAANPRPVIAAVLDAHPPLASIWIGTRTTVPAHWDMSNNIAVAAVGRRRFTLFPPDQVANLYPGPLDPTPAGQVVSLVDPAAPDLARFPDFPRALAAAEVADLEPGDVLIYPALWWHQVEALDPFNVLINYWWNDVEDFVDSPMVTLLHALLALRERPAAERAAWRHLFDYHIFGDTERPAAHLPAHTRGPLAPLDAPAARRLRAEIGRRLNR